MMLGCQLVWEEEEDESGRREEVISGQVMCI